MLVRRRLTSHEQKIAQTQKVTRLSMIRTLGQVSVKRRRGIEQVLREMIGDKFDWKVVSAGVDFEHAGIFGRIMGALMAPLPVVWIRIAV